MISKSVLMALTKDLGRPSKAEAPVCVAVMAWRCIDGTDGTDGLITAIYMYN